MDFASADLADAFTNFPVHPNELCNCVSPAFNPAEVFIFVALLFGHKSAPLIMCRFSALLARLLQTGAPKCSSASTWTILDAPRFSRKAGPQLVLGVDDFSGAGDTNVLGEGRSRFGLAMDRGQLFRQMAGRGLVQRGPPKDEGRHRSKALQGGAGLCRGTSNIGRQAVLGNRDLPRWSVSIIYKVLAQHLADVADGTEARRRGHRADKRVKDHLVSVKRFEAGRLWLVALFRQPVLATRKSLWQTEDTIMLICDASPQGCGGVMLVRATSTSEWIPFEAYEYKVEKQDTMLLGLELLSHRSQAYLEALAIFLALKLWSALLRNISVGLGIRSDSTVALAILEKASSLTPALNLLAGEITLLLESLQVANLTSRHVPGKINKVANYLSRPLTREATLPAELHNVKKKTPKRLTLGGFALPLAGRTSHDATSTVSAAWPAIKAE